MRLETCPDLQPDGTVRRRDLLGGSEREYERCHLAMDATAPANRDSIESRSHGGSLLGNSEAGDDTSTALDRQGSTTKVDPVGVVPRIEVAHRQFDGLPRRVKVETIDTENWIAGLTVKVGDCELRARRSAHTLFGVHD